MTFFLKIVFSLFSPIVGIYIFEKTNWSKSLPLLGHKNVFVVINSFWFLLILKAPRAVFFVQSSESRVFCSKLREPYFLWSCHSFVENFLRILVTKPLLFSIVLFPNWEIRCAKNSTQGKEIDLFFHLAPQV